MSISISIIESIERSSWIRKMFEEGAKLKAKYGQENVFDFSLGNPDLPPPDAFFDIMEELAKERNGTAHGYMPNAGFPYVRESIANEASEELDCDLNADQIILTCGAAGGLNVIFKTILDPGDQVIVLKPYFVEYGFYISNHNGEMVFVETNEDFSLNVENIKDAITPKTKAVLINSPNNPTGKVYSKEEIEALSKLLNEYSDDNRSIYLISDEPYRKIVYDGILVPGIFNYYSQSIVVTSYSKTLSIPGERIGYIAVNPSCAEINKLISGLIFSNRILGFVNAPALIQRVVAKLPDISVDVEAYKRRRDLLMNGLKDAGYQFPEPDGAFYLFCKSPIEDDVEFVKQLQKYNILVVPGVGFGGPGYFRISYTVSEDMIERSLPGFEIVLKSIE